MSQRASFLQGWSGAVQNTKKRPRIHTYARRINQSLRWPVQEAADYRQGAVPNAAYMSPGRGVSGESSN